MRCARCRAVSCGSAASGARADRWPMPCRSRDRPFRHRSGPRLCGGRDRGRLICCRRGRSLRSLGSLAASRFSSPNRGRARNCICCRAPSRPTPSSPTLQAWAGLHLWSIDLEVVAALDSSAVDDLFQMGLALDQRQLPKVIAVEVKQIERDQNDLGRFAL